MKRDEFLSRFICLKSQNLVGYLYYGYDTFFSNIEL